jgi:hypothetical protein
MKRGWTDGLSLEVLLVALAALVCLAVVSLRLAG